MMLSEKLSAMGRFATRRNLIWISAVCGIVVVGLIAIASAQRFAKNRQTAEKPAKGAGAPKQLQSAKVQIESDADAEPSEATGQPTLAPAPPTETFQDPFATTQSSPAGDEYQDPYAASEDPYAAQATQYDPAPAEDAGFPDANVAEETLVPVQSAYQGDTQDNGGYDPATASNDAYYGAGTESSAGGYSAPQYARENDAANDPYATPAPLPATDEGDAYQPSEIAENEAALDAGSPTEENAEAASGDNPVRQPTNIANTSRTARTDRTTSTPPAAPPEQDPYLTERFPDAEPARIDRAQPSNSGPAATATRGVLGEGVPGDPKLEAEQGASLLIHKTGPPEVQLGIETTYEIRVENAGDVAAHNVEIRDIVPQGAELIATQPQVAPGIHGELVWPVGTLQPGEDVLVQMRVIPRAEGEIGSVARVTFSADAAARTLVTRPQLELSVEAPKSVLAGERAQVFVRVTNNGTGVATGVVLEEIVPAGFEHPGGATLEYRVGTLKPRDSRELPLTLTALKPTESVNVVSARADGDIVVEKRTPLAVVAPELKIDMQGPKRRFLDRDATYTVAVSNPGTAPAHEIELVTFLADGMEFVSADNAGQYDPQTRAVYWLLDELPPNEMGAVTVTARPTKPGEHLLRVEGHAQRGLEAIEEQPILVEGLAAVEFQVVDLADPVEINGEAAYEIVVKNGGTKAAADVELVIQLPVEMKLLSAEGPARYHAAGQKIAFEPLKSLAPGQSVSYQLTAKTLEAGDARLQVKLLTAEMQSPVTKEENTKVFGDE